jgi:hypothetical protein
MIGVLELGGVSLYAGAGCLGVVEMIGLAKGGFSSCLSVTASSSLSRSTYAVGRFCINFDIGMRHRLVPIYALKYNMLQATLHPSMQLGCRISTWYQHGDFSVDHAILDSRTANSFFLYTLLGSIYTLGDTLCDGVTSGSSSVFCSVPAPSISASSTKSSSTKSDGLYIEPFPDRSISGSFFARASASLHE